MKIYKYIIGLVLIAGGFISCDTDNIGTIYNPTMQNVSFDSDNAATVTTTDSEVEVKVMVSRNIKQGEYTAHYTVTPSADNIFTDVNNGSLTFSDGQSVAYIVLKAANLVKGEEYTAKLALSEADAETTDTIIGAPKHETVVTVVSDYSWQYLGTGYYNSGLFGEGWDQDVYKAEEGNIYKLPDCVYKGYDLKFELSEDGNSLVAFNPQPMGYKTSYGQLYFYSESMTRTDNTITFEMYGFVIYQGSFADYIGGTFPESITLPE